MVVIRQKESWSQKIEFLMNDLNTSLIKNRSILLPTCQWRRNLRLLSLCLAKIQIILVVAMHFYDILEGYWVRRILSKNTNFSEYFGWVNHLLVFRIGAPSRNRNVERRHLHFGEKKIHNKNTFNNFLKTMNLIPLFKVVYLFKLF